MRAMDTTTAAHPPNVDEIVAGMRAKLAREDPSIGARRKLHNLLTHEAEDAYRMGRYDAALVAWAKLLAVIEGHTKLVWRAWLWGEGVDDNEHRASCLANIGAALHQRGDGREAIAYYEQVPSRQHQSGCRSLSHGGSRAPQSHAADQTRHLCDAQAVTAFDEMGTGRVTWLLYGDVNGKRAEYLRKRVVEVSPCCSCCCGGSD